MICKCKVTPKEVTADLPLLLVQSFTTFQQTQLDAKFLQWYTCTLNVSSYLYCSYYQDQYNGTECNEMHARIHKVLSEGSNSVDEGK